MSLLGSTEGLTIDIIVEMHRQTVNVPRVSLEDRASNEERNS